MLMEAGGNTLEFRFKHVLLVPLRPTLTQTEEKRREKFKHLWEECTIGMKKQEGKVPCTKHKNKMENNTEKDRKRNWYTSSCSSNKNKKQKATLAAHQR